MKCIKCYKLNALKIYSESNGTIDLLNVSYLKILKNNKNNIFSVKRTIDDEISSQKILMNIKYLFQEQLKIINILLCYYYLW